MPGKTNNRVPIQKHMQLKRAQKKHHDKTARNLKPLSESDVVRIEEPDAWNRKAVVLKEVGPRSYTVRTEDGQVFRRNRRCLLRTQETFQKQSHAQVTNPPDAQKDVHPTEHQTSTSEAGPAVRRKSGRARRSRVMMDL